MKFDDQSDSVLANLRDLRAEIEKGARPKSPPGWEQVPTDNRPGKTRVTIRIDSDVADWFRDMGPGWQTRLNAVLRMFWEQRRD